MSVFDGERRYFIYIFGSGMALLSIWMQRLAVQWIIWEQTQLLTWNGILLLVEVATTIVISPLLGPFVDRWNIARSMAMLQILIALLSMLMATLAGLGILTMVPLLTIRFVQGALVAAQQPMRMALTPQLVSARFLPKAIAIRSLNFNLTRIVGPAIGALLLSIYGVDVTLWAGAAGYVPFSLILLGLQ